MTCANWFSSASQIQIRHDLHLARHELARMADEQKIVAADDVVLDFSYY